MKPTKLSMTAFGPFAECESINFLEIEKEPVFLICGPTGAGKTTIFDAISYALFGDASGEDRKPDAMRSDFAKEDKITQVELEFTVRSKPYRILRQPRQTRLKKSGDGYTEIAGKVELSYQDSDNQPIVITKVAEVTEKIKEIIGLGSEQFKQIMMLPQGEFRKLLIADSKERESILRDIFDAERYLHFQLLLKEKSDTLEKEIKEIRQQEMPWIMQLQAERLGEEQENPKETNLAEILKRQEIDRLELFERVESLNSEDSRKIVFYKEQAEENAIQVNQEKEKFFHKQKENQDFEELKQIQARFTLLEAKKPEIEEKQREIVSIQKAIELKPYEEYCQKLQSQLADQKHEERLLQEKIEIRQKQYQELERQYEWVNSMDFKRKMEGWEQRIQELSAQIPLLIKLMDLKQRYVQTQQQYKEKQLLLQQIRTDKLKLQEKIKQIRQSLLQKEGMEEKCLLLEQKIQRFQKIKNLDNRFRELQKEQLKRQEIERELLQQEAKLQVEYREMLEKIRQNHVLAIRHTLVDGDICPVCNQEYHTQEELSAMEVAENDLNTSEKELERIRIRIREVSLKKRETDTLLTAVREQVLEESGMTEISEFLQWLEKEQNEVVKNTEQLMHFHREAEMAKKEKDLLFDCEKEIENQEQKEEKLQSEFQQAQSDMAAVAGEGKALKESVLLAYQDKAKNEEIVELKATQEELQKKRQESLAKRDEIVSGYQLMLTQRAEDKTNAENLQQRIQKLAEEWQAEKQKFIEKQIAAGFEEEHKWQEMVAKASVKTAVEEDVASYQQDYLRVVEEEKRLLGLVKLEKPHDLKEIWAEIEVLEQRCEEQKELSFRYENRFKDNLRILNHLKKMEQEREKLLLKYSQIAPFAKIANGDNSKKMTFERYVLAAFLEDVLQMANYRLQKMTGRYTLKRKEEVTHRGRQSGLEIEVFDAFTGKTRSVNTLSGGEGFKAALAMALGLSEVVSSYAGGIELDMLFIDEGFGTLDPESLDSAIDTIMELQDKGKIIGIISHVAELKERIGAKLEVVQTPQGSYTKYHVGKEATGV